MVSFRSGRFVKQPLGYHAFIPATLPPDPPLRMDAEIVDLLARASEKLGRLDGLTVNLPNPDLFVSMFVRKEAVLSSQIEGTQASLDDILAYELKGFDKRAPADVTETINYVNAMNYGLRRIQELPLSLRLIREIHKRLLENVRGANKTPGEFRGEQNWIGPPGCSIEDASFVPPPPHEMKIAMGELEKYLHDVSALPVLMKSALVHAQFETIHPFLDGNGRIGRLLITFMLCHQGALSKPLLYLSYYFKANRKAYYDHLNRIRTDGDWESWLRFFLRGVAEVAGQATDTAKQILLIRSDHIELIRKAWLRGTPNALRLLDLLFERPGITASLVSERLKVSRPTAYALINRFEKLGILDESAESPWGRISSYGPYLRIIRKGTEIERNNAQEQIEDQNTLPGIM